MKKLNWLTYRLKWHLAPYFNFSAPVHVDIELTSRCNLKCTFCHQQDQNYEIGDIDINMLKRIIDDCVETGVKSVKFNWRGEATLYQDFDLVLCHAATAGLYVYLNTNLAREYKSHELKSLALYVDVLKVSIDTIDQPLYADIRKGARFTKTMIHLIELADYRKAFKMPPIIISRRTLDGMEDDKTFKAYFKQFGKFKFDIRPAMPRNSNMKKQSKRKRKYCGQPSRRLVIGWDGKAFPCCVAYNEPDNLRLIGGQTINHLWNSVSRSKIVDTLKKGWGYPIECDRCSSKDAYK